MSVMTFNGKVASCGILSLCHYRSITLNVRFLVRGCQCVSTIFTEIPANVTVKICNDYHIVH